LAGKSIDVNDMFEFEEDEHEALEDSFKRQSLASEVYAARKSTDWRDFVNVGKKWGT
jgi:hypothetical protein